MPRALDREDHRNHMFVWILIGALWKSSGWIDMSTFHKVVGRFVRELKKLNIELAMYPNIVNETYPDAHDAIMQAIDHHILGMPRPGSSRIPITGDVDRFLKKQDLLTDEEIEFAKQAAKISNHAFLWGHVDDDLTDENPAAATL